MGVLIAYLLGVLTAVRRKNQDRKHVDHETHKDCKRFPVPLPIVNVPVAQSDQERTKQEKKECREKWKFRGEIGGLIVLTVYAVFTIATWWQVKKSTDAAVRNFQTDERAW